MIIQGNNCEICIAGDFIWSQVLLYLLVTLNPGARDVKGILKTDEMFAFKTLFSIRKGGLAKCINCIIQ